jgi:penicillin-insensitive murein endopeptidase
MTGVRTLCLVLTVLGGCGSPEVIEDGVDQMHFVEDEAIEQAGPRPGPSELAAAVCTNERSAPARSLGGVGDGSLEEGCEMPAAGPGYARISPYGCGTDEAVAALQVVAFRLNQAWPGSEPLVVGDLSQCGGGPLKRHKSHRSGRDADIGLLYSDGLPSRAFRPAGPANLDVDRTGRLLQLLLSTGLVRFVFMDYEIQALLYESMADAGVRQEWLDRVFQYPAGREVPRGLIRHAAGHADHIHVRFVCPPEAAAEGCIQ